MSTLFGNNISQTYQGLLKLTDSTSGLTSTLQTVESGDGTDSPLQISQTQVNISGSLTINGNPVTNVNTGSFVTTSSFNAYTSSVNTQLAGLDIETGSLQNQINGLATTGSLSGYTTVTTFNNYTGSNDSKVNSLISKTGSYATTGSNQFNGNQSITGSLTASSTVTSLDGFVGPYLQSNINLSVIGNQIVDIKTNTTNNNGKVRLYSNGNYPFKVEVSGSLNVRDGITGSLQGTASYATQALSASYAPDNSNRNGLINTGSIGGTQSITGSLDISGTLTATSASITYLETVYETASIIYSSGSNQLGDASNDTQTLFGTVNLPAGNLNVTGATTSSLGFFGNLQGTASYATQALSASYAPMPDVSGFATTGSNIFKGNQTVDGDIIISGSGRTIVIPEANYIKLYGDADGSSTSAAIQFYSGSNANRWLNIQAVPTSTDGDVAISDFPTNNHFMFFEMSSHNIQFEAPLAGTGSAPMETKTGFINNTNYNPTLSTNERGFINSGSMVVRGNLFNLSNNTSLNPDTYLTSSLFGQSNIIKGWGDNPGTAGAGSNQANYTGSLRITGSNNTVSLPQLRATGLGGGADLQGYISGSDNTLMSNNSGIYLNTGSLLFPKTTNNYLGTNSSILMNFTTSSLAGGHPLIQNNTLYAGQIAINSNSGSINSTGNLLNGGVITSTQNFVTNIRPAISTNVVVGTSVTLNHISSSIGYSSNISNASVTVNNAVSSSIANNVLSLSNNTFLGGLGGTHLIFASGSQSSNSARTINNNLIGGVSNIISSSFISSSNANLNSTIIYGNNLAVSASHTLGTFGGSAFLGRFNDTGSLADSQNIVFAVGTGAGLGNRRTGLWIDQGSITNVSGALNLTGSLNVSGSNVTTKLNGNTSINGVTNVLTVTGSATIKHSIAGQNALTVINSVGLSQPGLEVQGTTTLLGNTLISGSAVPLRIVGQSMTNVGLQVTGETTLIGNTSISGSNPLRVGINNSTSVIQSLGGSQFLYRDGDNNTVVGNANGVGSGFFPGSEKNMIFNGFSTPFTTGSNNVLIQGGGDDFISGSNNIFIGNHNGQAGGSGNLLIGGMSYSSGSIFNNKFEINNNSTRIFHKQGSDPLQIGTNTQVTGSLRVSGDVMFASGSNTTMGTAVLDGGNPGTVTVANTLVTANSLIYLTKQTNNHPNAGPVVVSSKGTNTFTITSNHNGDTDTVAYLIINPA